MPLMQVIIAIVVVGLLMWLVNTYLPLAEPFKTILNVVVVIALVLYLLSAFGVLGALGTVPAQHHRVIN